jgi:hypothetical protein
VRYLVAVFQGLMIVTLTAATFKLMGRFYFLPALAAGFVALLLMFERVRQELLATVVLEDPPSVLAMIVEVMGVAAFLAAIWPAVPVVIAWRQATSRDVLGPRA